MSLGDIIQKQEIVYTPLAQEIAHFPEEQESKFKFHVTTYVTIADIENRWNATVDNLLKGKSATGLIYADTGYGKTSTGASLWNYAESKGFVAVPPFRWDSLSDMLTATHGWVCYRLKDKRQDLISALEEKYRSVVSVGEEVLAQKMSHEKNLSVAQSREAIALVKAEGRFRDELSPRDLLDYIRFATQQLLAAGYKGLLILPDEFQLFKNNPDSTQNLNRLKEFIFGIGEEKLPIGCITLTYNETFANIKESESNYMLARFAKPAGNIINLETLYGETDFARHLWDKLADLRNLSTTERASIDGDVLHALGQFFRHSRSRALISGPRSVVATFRRAALHYTEKNLAYSLLDFCKDYLDGIITFSSQHTEAAQAHTRIMALPEANTPEKRKAVKLLCIHPEGVPPEIFQKYDIPDSDRESFIDSLLPEHVITKVAGHPTLACHRDDLHGIDELNEILKRLKVDFNSTNRTLHQGAVRVFRKHVFPEIFTAKKQGALLGWTGMQEPSESWDSGCTMNMTGALPNLREYPNRKLRVDIGTEEIVLPTSTFVPHLQVRFILDVTGEDTDTCSVTANCITFRFNIQKSINPQKVPEEIGKLKDLFLPENITPLLLLSILDFFDKESTISIVKGAKQDVQVESLKNRILGELIRYFFSSEVKECAVESSEELVSVSTGKGFVEDVLKFLMPKQFPDYYAVAISKGWENDLGKYRDALSKGYPLGVRKGIDPIKAGSKLFNIGQVAFDNFRAGVARNLLKVEYETTKRDEADVSFILHPFEKLLVKQLENSPIVAQPVIYQQAKKLGYLDEEVQVLLEILKARGLVDKKQEGGTNYVYLVETIINYSELKSKMEKIEEVVAFAKENDFEYQCNTLSSARILIGTHGIGNNEVQKDELRQDINSAEENLDNKCTEWIKTWHEKLRQQIDVLETLHIEVPVVLEQQTAYPLTKFTVILFDSVQSDVKRAYTKISDGIQKVQRKVDKLSNQGVATYQSGKTPRSAIEAASRLRQACFQADDEIQKLKDEQKNAQELYRLFEFWRTLALQINGDKQLMVNIPEDSIVQCLIMRFEVVQEQIRDHLGNKRISLKDVLGNHEHFKTQIDEIKTEFDQYLGGKEKAFIADQANIEEMLAKLIDTPHVGVKWNPSDIDGGYRETREKTVEKLRNVVDTAQNQLENVTRALLGPIETYAVPESLKASAIQMSKDVGQYSEEFQAIRPNLITENVDPQLSNWVSELISLRQKGEDIRKRWEKIEHDVTGFRNQLSPSTQKLHDAVNPLLDDGTFNSPSEIIERLEELYQLH